MDSFNNDNHVDTKERNFYYYDWHENTHVYTSQFDTEKNDDFEVNILDHNLYPDVSWVLNNNKVDYCLNNFSNYAVYIEIFLWFYLLIN